MIRLRARLGDGAMGRVRFLRLNPAGALRWMDLCGVASEQTREVIKEIACTPARRGWWVDYPDAFPTDYPGLEHDRGQDPRVPSH